MCKGNCHHLLQFCLSPFCDEFSKKENTYLIQSFLTMCYYIFTLSDTCLTKGHLLSQPWSTTNGARQHKGARSQEQPSQRTLAPRQAETLDFIIHIKKLQCFPRLFLTQQIVSKGSSVSRHPCYNWRTFKLHFTRTYKTFLWIRRTIMSLLLK